MGLSFLRVDVFSVRQYGGNSLAVFPDAEGLTGAQMLTITQELRHFETIFLEQPHANSVIPARVFDLVDELPFAGHPSLGAAAVLHRAAGVPAAVTHKLAFGERIVTIRTETVTDTAVVRGTLDQGRPIFGPEVAERQAMAAALTLGPDDIDPSLPLAVVSTGLRYLVVPVCPGALAQARVAADLGPLLHSHGADYAVLLDDDALEVRHWTNDGALEDVATGSAAGCIGAYRLRYGRAIQGKTFILAQGRYAGRPSVIEVTPHGGPSGVTRVDVGGAVAFVGTGRLDVLP